MATQAREKQRERYVIGALLRDESYGEIAVALRLGENAVRAWHSQTLVKIKAERQLDSSEFICATTL